MTTPGPLPRGASEAMIVAEVTRVLAIVPQAVPVVAAVSGGGDSTALALLVAGARPDLVLTLATVRHGLHDDAVEVAAVRRLARALRVQLEVREVDVRVTGAGIEAAARSARYAALRHVADEVGAPWVLVGHTADDQAETLLLRAARGTGLDGLGGMAPVTGDLVRPLLRVRRADLPPVVEAAGLEAARDPMNDDPTFARVTVRGQVLPALARAAPDPVGALGRLADLARDDAAELQALTDELARRVFRSVGPARVIALDDLGALSPALARRVVRRLLDEVRPELPPTDAAHVEAVLALRAGQAVDVPGAFVTCGGGWLAAVPPGATSATGDVALDIDGSAAWPATAVRLAAVPPGSVAPPPAAPVPGGDPRWATLRIARGAVEWPLSVRSRRPGDRIVTTAGHRRLKDVMVDAGVPRAIRDLLPVVLDRDRVVWVPGVIGDATVAADEGNVGAVLTAVAGTGTGRER